MSVYQFLRPVIAHLQMKRVVGDISVSNYQKISQVNYNLNMLFSALFNSIDPTTIYIVIVLIGLLFLLVSSLSKTPMISTRYPVISRSVVGTQDNSKNNKSNKYGFIVLLLLLAILLASKS